MQIESSAIVQYEMQQFIQIRRRKRNARIRRPVIDHHAFVLLDPPARKHHIIDVALALVSRFRPEDPLIRPPYHLAGILQVQKCKPQSVNRPAGRGPHPMIQNQPPLRRFQRRRRQADLVRIPPRPLAHG